MIVLATNNPVYDVEQVKKKIALRNSSGKLIYLHAETEGAHHQSSGSVLVPGK